MRYIDKIIVHCSATPNERDVTVADIRKWHVEENGWDDIGYHYVIYRNGAIYTGRPCEIIGAHCRGYNTGSIGVCLIGDNEFTQKQFDALRKLNSIFKGLFNGITIHGHRDFTDKKSCPNFEVKEVIGE